MFSGIGIALEHVFFGWDFICYYFLFLFCFCVSYALCSQAMRTLSDYTGRVLEAAATDMDSSSFWAAIPYIYIFLHVIPLLYPNFILFRVIAPPTPEVFTVTRDFHQYEGITTELVRYAILLSTPFFYISVFRLRSKIGLLTLLLYLPVYLTYVRYSYVGRKSILEPVAVLAIALWVAAPRWRKRLIVASLTISPLLLFFFGAYSQMRMGHGFQDIDVPQALRATLEAESLSSRHGPAVLASGARVEIVDYATWISTLPIPGVFLQSINRANINVEISEVVLGISRVSPRFYGAFAGLFIESFYIFGEIGFWIHAVFIGCASAFGIGLIKKAPQSLFLLAAFIVLLGFSLNRGGIAAWLSVMVNSNLLLFLWLVVRGSVLHMPTHRHFTLRRAKVKRCRRRTRFRL